MGANDNNPAWLLYLESKQFPLGEYWRLVLDWMHTGRPLPARLTELSDRRRQLLAAFEATELQRRKRQMSHR